MLSGILLYRIAEFIFYSYYVPHFAAYRSYSKAIKNKSSVPQQKEGDCLVPQDFDFLGSR